MIEGESNREKHLQLLLFIYRTTRHASIGLSPSEVLFGVNPSPLQIPRLPSSVIPDPCEYSVALKAKLATLREMVDANIVHSAEHQQSGHGNSGCFPQVMGD